MSIWYQRLLARAAGFCLGLALLPIFLACSCARPGGVPLVAPNPLAAPLSRAAACFQQGKTCLEKGDMPGARANFDRTLDLLMDGADGGGANVDAGSVLDDYIEKIAAIELNYLKDKNSPDNEPEEAFLDQVIATPLFLPSEKDILDVKQKVNEAAVVTYSIPMTVN